jgi:hypothetical protein
MQDLRGCIGFNPLQYFITSALGNNINHIVLHCLRARVTNGVTYTQGEPSRPIRETRTWGMDKWV